MKLNKKKRAISSLYYINNKNNPKHARESAESLGVINMEDDLDNEIKD